MEQIALDQIAASKTNPAGRVLELNGLVDSIRLHGVLQPIVIRPTPGTKPKIPYELVCGHRRHAAAGAAGLEKIPAIVRSLSDDEALELQIIENLQRQDLHPLDEARGYLQLRDVHKHDVARIAERIGRSVPYVYDRLRLLDLTKDAQQLLRAGAITAGHAVVLSRLKPADQTRALRPNEQAVFQSEVLLWQPEGDANDNGKDRLKPRSVRELQQWVDKHVRFAPEAEFVPQLFPETATLLTQAQEQREKIVPITHTSFVHPDAKTGERVYGPASWRRADGRLKSKTCEYSGVGVIVVGPGRGQGFRVCVSKSCPVHFAKKAKRSIAGGGTGSRKTQEDWERRQATANAKRDREEKQWEKAVPEILATLAAATVKLQATPQSAMGKYLIEEFHHRLDLSESDIILSPGKTADDLVRYLFFCWLANDVIGSFGSYDGVTKELKAFGINVAKILEQTKDAPTPGVCSKCGCTEEKACEGGCSWVNPEQTLCSSCEVPPKTEAKAPAKKKRASARKATPKKKARRK